MATVSQLSTVTPSNDDTVDSLQDEPAVWNFILPFRNTLFYTFDASDGSHSALARQGAVTPFNPTQQASTRAILAHAASLTGLIFAQVSRSDAADLHFAMTDVPGFDISGQTKAEWGYSFTGAQHILTSLTADAVVYLDSVEHQASNAVPTPGTTGYQVLLHEIAHALGLGHPFEGGRSSRSQWTIPRTR